MPDVLAFCAEPGCSGIATNSRWCSRHLSENYEKRARANRPERDSWYLRAAWRGPYGVRGYKLRHSPICERCNRAKATQVHHRDDSWKETGDWSLFIDQKNLESLCDSCHSAETMKRNRERGVL